MFPKVNSCFSASLIMLPVGLCSHCPPFPLGGGPQSRWDFQRNLPIDSDVRAELAKLAEPVFYFVFHVSGQFG